MITIERKEGLPGGGWHTVRRVLIPHSAQLQACPACGNDHVEKFETYATGSPPTLRGYLCMACVRPMKEAPR